MIVSDAYIKKYSVDLGTSYQYDLSTIYTLPVTELPSEEVVSSALSKSSLNTYTILREVLSDLTLSVSDAGSVGSPVNHGIASTAWNRTTATSRVQLRTLGVVPWSVGYENLVIFWLRGYVVDVIIVSRTELGLDPSASAVEFGTIIAATEGDLNAESN